MTCLIQRVQKMGMQGQNIFLLDVTGLIAKIDAQPEVDTADLSKQWPNQLVISIKERVPVLLWQTAQGIFSVDSQGMVIAPAGNTVGANDLSTVIDMSQHTSTGKADNGFTARDVDKQNRCCFCRSNSEAIATDNW